MSKETTRGVSATNLVMEKELAWVQMKVKITTKMMMIRTKTTSLKMTMMRTKEAIVSKKRIKTTTKRTREVTASKTTMTRIREATVSKTKMTKIREAIVNKMRMIKTTKKVRVKVNKEMILETN